MTKEEKKAVKVEEKEEKKVEKVEKVKEKGIDKIFIEGHETRKNEKGIEFTLYHIKVKRGDEEWTIKKRYTQIEGFHYNLAVQLLAKLKFLPSFPPKIYKGKQLLPENIEKRTKALNAYFEAVLKNPDWASHHLTLEFAKKQDERHMSVHDKEVLKKQEDEEKHEESELGKFKLIYLPVGGRGDQIRLIFKYTGTEFEDERIPFEEIQKRTENGELPFGQVPVLHHDGFVLAQACAIVKYVSQILKIWPEDPNLSATAMSLTLSAEDFRIKMFAFYFEKDEERKKKKLQEVTEWAKSYQENLEKMLDKKRFFFGDNATGADLAVFQAFNIWKNFKMPVTERIEQFYSAIMENKAVHDYLSK